MKHWGNESMQFGMPTLVENETLEENVALCKRLHLNFIELNMNFPEYQIDQMEKNVSRFKKLAEETGIYYTIHLDENMNVADFNPLVREAYLETARRTIDMAKQFIYLRDAYGQTDQPFILNMHMHHGIYITLPDRKVQMYDRDFDVYWDAFREFRGLCEEWIGNWDIAIAIENTDRYREYEKKVMEYLLESPKFVLTWDIGHSKSDGERDMPYLMKHKKHLKHFHIHDGREVPAKNHLALGDGEIDMAARLRLAGECNARCVLETKTIQALEKSVKWIDTYLSHCRVGNYCKEWGKRV